MKLLFIAKREPQQRDLVEHPYGRFHWLPQKLAQRGHDVKVFLVSHRGRQATALVRDGVHVVAFNPKGDGLRRTLAAMQVEALAFRPDWIIGCSDAWYGWLAARLSRRTHARLAVDAYDNYEAYMPWNLLLHWQWRRALSSADVTFAAGPQLAELLDRQRRGKRQTDIVPMAADPHFIPHDRREARELLGLPLDTPLVGYSGGWGKYRGTDVLVRAFRCLRQQLPAARLVVTGSPPADALAEPGVVSLGYLDDAKLPFVHSAVDAACAVTADTPFGRYSYPAKLCEIMACQTAVVATATAPVQWMLNHDQEYLAPVGDARRIADLLIRHIGVGQCVRYQNLPSWGDSACSLDLALNSHR